MARVHCPRLWSGSLCPVTDRVSAGLTEHIQVVQQGLVKKELLHHGADGRPVCRHGHPHLEGSGDTKQQDYLGSLIGFPLIWKKLWWLVGVVVGGGGGWLWWVYLSRPERWKM